MNSKLVFLMDLLLSLFASGVVITLASLISASGAFSGEFIWIYMLAAFFGTVFATFLFRGYRIIIRHSGMREVLVYSLTALVKDVVMLAVLVLVCSTSDFLVLSPNAYIVLSADFFLTVCLLVGVRVLMVTVYSVFREQIREEDGRKRVFVYGTSDKSVALLKRLETSLRFRIMGFVSCDEDGNKSLNVSRLPAFWIENADQFGRRVSEYGVKAILFASERDVRAESDRVLRYASALGVKALLVPHIEENGVESVPAIREVNVEDLLGRDEIEISMGAIKEYFQRKKVMVTGAAGSIGSELCRQLALIGVERLILFDNAETPIHNLRLELAEKFPYLSFVPVVGDVRYADRVDFAFRQYHPDVVFHAAAYKHVPLMEENPCEAVLVNVQGTRIVADKCVEYGVDRMVMISTDKAVNPTNVMGCSKRLAEIYVQSLGLALASGRKSGRTKFVTTRFGNVLGSNGSVIPRFRSQIEKGGPVTVTHPEINRFFMTIPEACRLVMEAATVTSGNQIVVFDMGKPVKIDYLARRMIELSGLRVGKDIKIEYTGLRPGEKLYEEVLSSIEDTDPTSHDRIRIAHVREYDYEDALRQSLELSNLAVRVRITDMVRLMKEIVPEYKSNNSRFEELDCK